MSMKKMLTMLALAVISAPATVFAVASCPDKSAAPITTVGEAGLKCQETIAKEGVKYIKAKLKIASKCKLKNPAGACPTADDVAKLDKAAANGGKKIASACGTDTAQAALTSSYGSLTNDAVISSCVLGQHSVVADLMSAETTGVTTEPLPTTGKEREACIKEVANSGVKLLSGLHNNAVKCIAKQMKEGSAANLATVCVGSFSAGAFVPPTDVKTGEKQTKLFEKIDEKIAKKCAPAESLGHIATMFGCAGSETVGALQACLTCNGFNALADAVSQEYSENATFVAPGPGALQAAVSAASTGDKLLIGSGDYPEEVLITTDGLQLVGCGAASNARPRVIPPPMEVIGRGIRAAGVDGLVFQSISVFNQNNDGIFVADAQGVTFRDIVGDGNFNSRYAVFPITSENILIELCTVRAIADAGLYVGQSGATLLRHNDVRTSVASIEFENTVNGVAYNNYAFDNTAGMLVFKDNDLVDQSSCHEVHHNVFESNNRVNIGTGTVGGVPDGAGILIIANDSSLFHHNIQRDHRSWGMAIVNQQLAGFTPVDPDPEPDYEFIYSSVITGNGYDPHPDALVGGDIVNINNGVGNCQSDNTLDQPVVGNPLPPCTFPPSFPVGKQCPAVFPPPTPTATATPTPTPTVTP